MEFIESHFAELFDVQSDEEGLKKCIQKIFESPVTIENTKSKREAVICYGLGKYNKTFIYLLYLSYFFYS